MSTFLKRLVTLAASLFTSEPDGYFSFVVCSSLEIYEIIDTHERLYTEAL